MNKDDVDNVAMVFGIIILFLLLLFFASPKDMQEDIVNVILIIIFGWAAICAILVKIFGKDR